MAHAEITEGEACEFLQRFKLIDPAGLDSVASAVSGARCFVSYWASGRVVWCIRLSGASAWITAAAGQTSASVTAQTLQAIEQFAMGRGVRLIGFQTARRGLVRRAESCGYRATGRIGSGWVLKKALRHDA